jgi:hypothetical protein
MEIQDQPVKDCLEMVAAARTPADPLRAGRVSTGQLARVQRRRPSVRRGMAGAVGRSQQRLVSKIMDAEQVGGR